MHLLLLLFYSHKAKKYWDCNVWKEYSCPSVLFIMLTKNDIFFQNRHDKEGIEIKY